MNRREIQERLLLFRPDDPAPEPEVLRALELARADPHLCPWLEAHLDRQRQIEAMVRGVKVPAGLRDRILQPPALAPSPPVFPRRRLALWAAAAGLALLLGGWFWNSARKEDRFTAFRTRMAKVVLRDYRMSMVSRNLDEIRRYVHTHDPHRAHADYTLSQALGSTVGQGCLLFTWQGRPVSLLCLQTQAGQDLWLFVVNRTDVVRPPALEPDFLQISTLATFSWSQGDKIYLLAGKMDAATLRKFL